LICARNKNGPKKTHDPGGKSDVQN
jgi:hypothetical protein